MSILALLTDISGTEVSVEHQGNQTTALLFDQDNLDEEWAEELETWLETAEEPRKKKRTTT